MNCKNKWDYETIVKDLDRKLINVKNKCRRENFLVEEEKGLMVATQGHVERLIVREEKDTILTHNSVIKTKMLPNYCTLMVKNSFLRLSSLAQQNEKLEK